MVNKAGHKHAQSEPVNIVTILRDMKDPFGKLTGSASLKSADWKNMKVNYSSGSEYNYESQRTSFKPKNLEPIRSKSEPDYIAYDKILHPERYVKKGERVAKTNHKRIHPYGHHAAKGQATKDKPAVKEFHYTRSKAHRKLPTETLATVTKGFQKKLAQSSHFAQAAKAGPGLELLYYSRAHGKDGGQAQIGNQAEIPFLGVFMSLGLPLLS